MSSKRHLIRVAGIVGACSVAAALTGLPWADASSHAGRGAVTGAAAARCSAKGDRKIQFDGDDTPACVKLRVGKRGRRGRTGARGHIGHIGKTGVAGGQGPVGPTGLIGPTGPTGATGAVGAVGATGATGPSGAFVQASGSTPAGSDPGGHTVVVLGTTVGPLTFPQGPGTGTELTPSVARCPTSGPDQRAFDGGATITPSDTANDVVGIESAFPGLYVNQTEVDPLPLGSSPGGVSLEPANAYEVQAVIGTVTSRSTVTVQSYVVCGP
jgi:hypothetical protein